MRSELAPGFNSLKPYFALKDARQTNSLDRGLIWSLSSPAMTVQEKVKLSETVLTLSAQANSQCAGCASLDL